MPITLVGIPKSHQRFDVHNDRPSRQLPSGASDIRQLPDGAVQRHSQTPARRSSTSRQSREINRGPADGKESEVDVISPSFVTTTGAASSTDSFLRPHPH